MSRVLCVPFRCVYTTSVFFQECRENISDIDGESLWHKVSTLWLNGPVRRKSCFVANQWLACEQLVRQQAAERRQTLRPLFVVWFLATGSSISGRDNKEWNCQKSAIQYWIRGSFLLFIRIFSRGCKSSGWAWNRPHKHCAWLHYNRPLHTPRGRSRDVWLDHVSLQVVRCRRSAL